MHMISFAQREDYRLLVLRRPPVRTLLTQVAFAVEAASRELDIILRNGLCPTSEPPLNSALSQLKVAKHLLNTIVSAVSETSPSGTTSKT